MGTVYVLQSVGLIKYIHFLITCDYLFLITVKTLSSPTHLLTSPFKVESHVVHINHRKRQLLNLSLHVNSVCSNLPIRLWVQYWICLHRFQYHFSLGTNTAKHSTILWDFGSHWTSVVIRNPPLILTVTFCSIWLEELALIKF